MTRSNRIGLVLGGAFTIGVVGLLVYLHSRDAEVPSLGVLEADPTPRLVVVCPSAPPYVEAALGEAIDWWLTRGYEVDVDASGDCFDSCPDEEGRQHECVLGAISISSIDGWYAPEHVAHTVLWPDGQAIVLMPEVIDAADPTRSIDAPPLPSDVAALVVAHELGHAFDLDHVETDAGPLVARKTGHVMNPRVTGLGWDDEGISARP